MAWVNIKHSTNVEAVNYSEGTQELLVRFKGGAIYKYFGVTTTLYDGILVAKSPGAYLREKVFPNRKFEKVDHKHKAG